MRRAILTVLALLPIVAACDRDSKSDAVTVKGENGTVTVSANGQNFSMKASGDKSGSFTMSGDGGHFTMKASDGKQSVEINASGGDTNTKLPGFVAVYPGGKVTSTAINSGRDGAGGSLLFQANASPAAVIAWYKQKAASAGMSKAIDMDMGGTTMFSANADGGKKTLQVVAAASGNGARVQVNWSGGQ